MSSEEEIKAENIREVLILQQHHYQHIETERYWFMSVYAVVIGAVLSLIFSKGITIDANWLYLFLIVLSIIGFFINLRWMQTIALLGIRIGEIADKLGVKDEAEFEAPCKGIQKSLHLQTRILFPFFYFFVVIFLTALAKQVICDTVSGIFVILVIIYLVQNKKSKKLTS